MILRWLRRLAGFPVYTEAEMLAQTNADDLSAIVTRHGERDRYEMPGGGQFTMQQIGAIRRIEASVLKAEGR